jgi:hypothetical protein
MSCVASVERERYGRVGRERKNSLPKKKPQQEASHDESDMSLYVPKVETRLILSTCESRLPMWHVELM